MKNEKFMSVAFVAVLGILVAGSVILMNALFL